MASRVYFADVRGKHSLLDKVERLFRRARLDQVIARRDLVAVKCHFGERGNTSYVRPQYLRRLVDLIKKAGGKPFLTDANTLYVGGRANAVDHLETAVLHGFEFAVVGAPVIIADGLLGKDYVNVEVNLKHFRAVKIGSAVHHADALVVVSHFKGHEATGFGGVLKNVGMGLGCRSGKQMMHSDILPAVGVDKCRGCGRCIRWCPAGAITLNPRGPVGGVADERRAPDGLSMKVAAIDPKHCIGCGECTVTCPEGAIAINWKTEPDLIQEKIVEYAYGVLREKQGKAAFITFATDVTPDCDCCGWSDAPVVRNIGLLASKDPVALDQACVDLVNRERGLESSRLAGLTAGADKFRALYPAIDWSRQLAYAEDIGLGKREYELVRLR
ncbi:MAG: DUF362 domain-containing protein [Bacillota bacterium]|nr:DUF362 domain-containing protein [Bacillota bacterium]